MNSATFRTVFVLAHIIEVRFGLCSSAMRTLQCIIFPVIPPMFICLILMIAYDNNIIFQIDSQGYFPNYSGKHYSVDLNLVFIIHLDFPLCDIIS